MSDGSIGGMFGALRRRRFVRVAAAYVVGAWVILQVGETVFDVLELPNWTARLLLATLVAGLPVALVIARVFNLDPADAASGETEPAAPRRYEFAELGAIDLARLDLGRPQLTPLVGRERDCEAIARHLDEAAAGRGGVVLIGGEPGIGKTRLGEEALELGLERSMLPLLGHAYEGDGAPFVTVIEILEDLARALPPEVLRNALGDTAPEIARLLPGLQRLLPDLPAPLEMPPEQQQRYLFNALLEFLRRLSGSAPVVMMLDDLQWADESSVLLLEHLTPHLPKLAILVVVTYRDVPADMGEPFKRILANFSRQGFVTRIPLRDLSRDDVAALLASLGGAEPPAPLVDTIHRETKGNAFFVQSVYRHLAEEGRLFDPEGGWRSDLDAAALAVPEGVRLVIQRRLERLGEQTRRVLTGAAVIGLRFDLGLLESMSEGSSDDVLDAIEAAESAGLALPSAGSRSRQYEFSHALVRQSMLEDLSVPRRQRLHLRIADNLERTAGAGAMPVADIARHLYRAGPAADAARTRRFLVLAGEQALSQAAPDEAIVAFDRAFELPEGMTEEERARLFYRRGFAWRALGRHDRAAADWHEALPRLEDLGRTDSVADLCWQLTYYYLWEADNRSADALSTRGLEAVGPEPSRARCRALCAYGMTQACRADFELADRYIDEAIELARALDDPRLLGSETFLPQVYRFEHAMRVDDMLATGGRAIALVREHGTPWEQSSTIGATLLAHAWHGDFETLREQVDTIMPVAEREGNVGTLVHCLAGSSIAALAGDDLESAVAVATRYIELGNRYNAPWRSLAYNCRGVAHLWCNAFDAATADFERCVDLRLETLSHFGLEPAAALYGYAMMGHERVESLYDDDYPLPVLGRDSSQGAWHWCLAKVQAAVLTGRDDDAAIWLPHIEQLMSQGMRVTTALGLTAKFAGLAAAAGGDEAAATKHFEEAIRLADTLPHHTEQAETRRWYAWALERFSGPADRVRELRMAARERYGRLGGYNPISGIPGQ